MECLPVDLLRHIFLFLSIDEIRQCFRVCKRFYHATQNKIFLLNVCNRIQPLKESVDGKELEHVKMLIHENLKDRHVDVENINISQEVCLFF